MCTCVHAHIAESISGFLDFPKDRKLIILNSIVTLVIQINIHHNKHVFLTVKHASIPESIYT